MEITAALAADLAILTEALDEPGVDIAESLHQLAADAQLAVRSYLGMTVTVSGGPHPLTFTVPASTIARDDVRTSLTVPLSGPGGDGTGVGVAVTLYAGRPGAFVDLAADLSWLTGRPLAEYVLDAQLSMPAESGMAGALRASAEINQAIGVLIARGHTPEGALRELESRAAESGLDRLAVAQQVLGTVLGADPAPVDPAVDDL